VVKIDNDAARVTSLADVGDVGLMSHRDESRPPRWRQGEPARNRKASD